MMKFDWPSTSDQVVQMHPFASKKLREASRRLVAFGYSIEIFTPTRYMLKNPAQHQIAVGNQKVILAKYKELFNVK